MLLLRALLLRNLQLLLFYVTVSSSGSLFFPIAYNGQSATVAELFVLVEENDFKKQCSNKS